MKEDRISIASPESIEFTYELAGIGSRFLANLIDTFLQIMAIGAVIGLLFLSGISLQFLNIFVTGLTSWGIAIAILSVFLIFWGYYIFFELLLNGQTPGKKAIGIRVIRDGGYPITLIEALARNLMRFVDFLPISYGLGVIVMFFNSNCKRLGDFAAGTIVVKERKTPLPAVIITGEKGKAVDCNVRLLSENDYGLIREFLGRKNKFDPKVQTEFARKLSLQLMKKLNLEELPASVDSYEEFLESVASQYRDREA